MRFFLKNTLNLVCGPRLAMAVLMAFYSCASIAGPLPVPPVQLNVAGGATGAGLRGFIPKTNGERAPNQNDDWRVGFSYGDGSGNITGGDGKCHVGSMWVKPTGGPHPDIYQLCNATSAAYPPAGNAVWDQVPATHFCDMLAGACSLVYGAVKVSSADTSPGPFTMACSGITPSASGGLANPVQIAWNSSGTADWNTVNYLNTQAQSALKSYPAFILPACYFHQFQDISGNNGGLSTAGNFGIVEVLSTGGTSVSGYTTSSVVTITPPTGVTCITAPTIAINTVSGGAPVSMYVNTLGNGVCTVTTSLASSVTTVTQASATGGGVNATFTVRWGFYNDPTFIPRNVVGANAQYSISFDSVKSNLGFQTNTTGAFIQNSSFVWDPASVMIVAAGQGYTNQYQSQVIASTVSPYTYGYELTDGQYGGQANNANGGVISGYKGFFPVGLPVSGIQNFLVPSVIKQSNDCVTVIQANNYAAPSPGISVWECNQYAKSTKYYLATANGTTAADPGNQTGIVIGGAKTNASGYVAGLTQNELFIAVIKGNTTAAQVEAARLGAYYDTAIQPQFNNWVENFGASVMAGQGRGDNAYYMAEPELRQKFGLAIVDCGIGGELLSNTAGLTYQELGMLYSTGTTTQGLGDAFCMQAGRYGASNTVVIQTFGNDIVNANTTPAGLVPANNCNTNSTTLAACIVTILGGMRTYISDMETLYSNALFTTGGAFSTSGGLPACGSGAVACTPINLLWATTPGQGNVYQSGSGNYNTAYTSIQQDILSYGLLPQSGTPSAEGTGFGYGASAIVVHAQNPLLGPVATCSGTGCSGALGTGGANATWTVPETSAAWLYGVSQCGNTFANASVANVLLSYECQHPTPLAALAFRADMEWALGYYALIPQVQPYQ